MTVIAKTRYRLQRNDLMLLLAVAALLVVGLICFYSASFGSALLEQEGGDLAHYLRRQIGWAMIGVVLMIVLSRIDYHLYQRHPRLIGGGTLAILAGTVLLGDRWIFGTSVQPSEAARVLAIIYLAMWLASKGDSIRDLHLGLLPYLALTLLVSGLIVAQKDLSTAALMGGSAVIMLWVAGADAKQMGLALGVLAVLATLSVLILRSGRITLWLNSTMSDQASQGFQCLRALNRGGLFGVGLGHSEQKFTLYAAPTDAIFAIIGEELGFLGAMFVMGLFGLFTWVGLRISRAAGDAFGMFLAVGIVMWVTLSAIMSIASVTNTIPFSGSVLPFISGGGSSLVSTLASMGILLNVSYQSAAAERRI